MTTAKTMRALLWGAALSAFAFGAAHAQDVPKGDAKAGLVTFQKYGCYSCHGIVGQGTLRDGPRLNTAIGYPALLTQLRTPRYEMPAYTTVQISDSGVADIFAYLSSIPKAPDAKTIKALQ
ncbi:MAG TPA: c-type cytochrome [Micropepsaceae bacterium]|nr:c-type cytochrome [Micropepsaceae bacterium]